MYNTTALPQTPLGLCPFTPVTLSCIFSRTSDECVLRDMVSFDFGYSVRAEVYRSMRFKIAQEREKQKQTFSWGQVCFSKVLQMIPNKHRLES